MKKSYLIADSGGTKTDWCFVDILGNTNYFTTASYHPNLMSDEWIEANESFWKKYSIIKDLEVHFYGSGCLKEPNRTKVKLVFEKWGFKDVQVESDILAAARACFGKEDGWIGILGTGSVLAEIENHRIKNVYGGLGPLIGDEGSGFYFGKLLIDNYLKDKFSLETIREIESTMITEGFMSLDSNAPANKEFIASLSGLFSGSLNLEIQQLHLENISCFIEKYFPATLVNKTICFVGSYAHYNQRIIKELLLKRHLNLGVVITKPIELLSEYSIKSTF